MTTILAIYAAALAAAWYTQAAWWFVGVVALCMIGFCACLLARNLAWRTRHETAIGSALLLPVVSLAVSLVWVAVVYL